VRVLKTWQSCLLLSAVSVSCLCVESSLCVQKELSCSGMSTGVVKSVRYCSLLVAGPRSFLSETCGYSSTGCSCQAPDWRLKPAFSCLNLPNDTICYVLWTCNSRGPRATLAHPGTSPTSRPFKHRITYDAADGSAGSGQHMTLL